MSSRQFQNSTKHKVSDAVIEVELGQEQSPPPPPPALSTAPPSVSAGAERCMRPWDSLDSLREWEATPKLPSRVKQPYYQPGRRATLLYAAVDGSRSSGDSDKGR